MTLRLATLLTAMGLFAACGTKATDTADAASVDDASGTDAAIGADVTATADATADVPAVWDQTRKWPNTQATPASGPLSAGLAQGYLDSPVGVSMAGYGGRDTGLHSAWSDASKATRGFYSKMTIKAMALQVGSERLIFVKSPLMTSESFLTDSIADRLLAKYGLDLRGRLIFSATHSHHAPARFWPIPSAMGGVGLDTFDPEITARMVASFADVIKASIDDLGPAEWAWGKFEDWDKTDKVYRDRRQENDPTWGKDPRLTLVAVRRPGGPMIGSILNFPVHGTAFDVDNDLLTEDAPGGVENKVEDAWYAQMGTPLQAMFMQCAGGDSAPAGDSLGHPTPSRIEKLGEDAAQFMMPDFATLQFKSTMALSVRTVRVDFAHEAVYAYPDLVHEFDDPTGAPYEDGGWQCAVQGIPDGQSMAGHPKQCIDLRTFIGALDVVFPYGPLNQALLSAARMDDLAIITLPGEPLYSLVQYAREKIEGKTPGITSLLVVGYSQDYFLYLPAPADWMVGGYESQMSLWGPAGGQFFADHGLALLADILAGNLQPTFWESSPSLSPPVAFTPRAVENSEDPNALLADAPTSTVRTANLDFAWGGGDSNLGPPTVVLQRQQGGTWADVPATNGHKGLSYDNSRCEMLTLYEPIPEVKSDILPSRKHHWRVHWQVPANLPLGTYRFSATGQAQGVDGKPVAIAVQSGPFQVGAGPTAFAATRTASTLTVTFTVPPIPYANETGESWPATGWRLIDRDSKPDATGSIRAVLHASIVAGGKTTAADLTFSETAKAYTFDLTPAGLTAAALDLTVEVKGSDSPGPTIHVAAP